jgi:hypothetical protein
MMNLLPGSFSKYLLEFRFSGGDLRNLPRYFALGGENQLEINSPIPVWAAVRVIEAWNVPGF